MQEFGSESFGVCAVHTAVTNSSTVLSKFVSKFLDILDGIILESKATTVCSQERKKMWSKFHQSRCSTFDGLWLEVTRHLKVVGYNPMFFQAVSRTLFEERLTIHFVCAGHSSSTITLDQEVTLDEKNVIMYEYSLTVMRRPSFTYVNWRVWRYVLWLC